MPVLQKVEEFVVELDAAVEAHMEWTRRVLRCAVSRTSPGDDVLASDAHCRCRLGRWMAGHRERLGQIDEAAAVHMLNHHERMHRAVRSLCSAIMADDEGRATDLESFEASQRALIADLARFKTLVLEHSARIDPLTGLPLRHGLDREFGRFRLAAAQLGKKTALMLIDIDHFKRINDTYGHAAGDLALKHAADILSDQAQGDETIFRFGGEEFLQLVRVDETVDAAAVADRLLRALRETPMILPAGQPLQLRASAGLAAVDHEEDIGRAIGRADRALYAAKAAGRDCWRWAEDLTV